MENRFLRHLRERAKLSQQELAELIDVGQTCVSRYESGEVYPPLPVALAYLVIFGRAPSQCFSALYATVEENVLARGAELDRKLRGASDRSSTTKRALLEKMMDRAVNRQGA